MSDTPRRNWYLRLWYEAFVGSVEDRFSARLYLIFSHGCVLLGLIIVLAVATLP